MSLSDLASLGSLVSGVAVLVSLVFLYVQMRQIGSQIEQAARNQRASIRAERASRTIQVMTGFAEQSLADATSVGNTASDEMSETQLRQYILFCHSRFTNAEDAFSQHADGLLGDTAFEGVKASLKAHLSTPGFRAAWDLLKAQYYGDFVVFMDELRAETPLMAAIDVALRLRAAFVAEKAKIAVA